MLSAIFLIFFFSPPDFCLFIYLFVFDWRCDRQEREAAHAPPLDKRTVFSLPIQRLIYLWEADIDVDFFFFFYWSKRRWCRFFGEPDQAQGRKEPVDTPKTVKRRCSWGRGEGGQLEGDDGGLRCGIEQLRDVRCHPGEYFFIMKPLAAADSNGVPSQQDKTPVSSLLTCNIFSPHLLFMTL